MDGEACVTLSLFPCLSLSPPCVYSSTAVAAAAAAAAPQRTLLQGSLIPQGQRPCVYGSQPLKRFWVPGFQRLPIAPHPPPLHMMYRRADFYTLDFIAFGIDAYK